jgi:hypothetical protein
MIFSLLFEREQGWVARQKGREKNMVKSQRARVVKSQLAIDMKEPFIVVLIVNFGVHDKWAGL